MQCQEADRQRARSRTPVRKKQNGSKQEAGAELTGVNRQIWKIGKKARIFFVPLQPHRKLPQALNKCHKPSHSKKSK